MPTLSIRILWPFARLLGSDPRALRVLADMGFDPLDLTSLDRRVRCDVAMQGLERAVEAFDEPLLGLRAGAVWEEGTFDLVEYLARSAKNLSGAIESLTRYSRLVHEGMETWLELKDGRASWCCLPRVPHPPAANDFIIATMLGFARRNCEMYLPPLEIQLMHPAPSYARDYAKFFETNVVFGAPRNAIVFVERWLQVPMRARNPELSAAFEQRARSAAQGLTQENSVTRSVRELLAEQLSRGACDMSSTAKGLEMSVATLRRRLAAEQTSFDAVLDQLRRDAAQHHLAQSELSVTEIAFMLGFSDVRAFGRAFKRWTGRTPSEARGRPPSNRP